VPPGAAKRNMDKSKYIKTRYVKTKFWSDGYIVKLDIIERYLFLYFLTNEHSNIAGIYEMPVEIIARESGVEKEMIEKIITRFSSAGKIYYIDGWVYVKNFAKHQAINDSVKQGIERERKGVPPEIMEKIDKIN